MILVLDNYDSFVWNLARYVSELGYTRVVKRNDEITVEDIYRLSPSHIIVSPGPCAPDQAGISLKVIRKFGATIPILGVCLGHQAIGQAYGSKVVRSQNPTHGKASIITHHQQDLFQDLENPLRVGRYHSLVVSEQGLPKELKITARCAQGEIMGLMHTEFPVFGVQFHPESVLTAAGYSILKNFFRITNRI